MVQITKKSVQAGDCTYIIYPIFVVFQPVANVHAHLGSAISYHSGEVYNFCGRHSGLFFYPFRSKLPHIPGIGFKAETVMLNEGVTNCIIFDKLPCNAMCQSTICAGKNRDILISLSSNGRKPDINHDEFSALFPPF